MSAVDARNDLPTFPELTGIVRAAARELLLPYGHAAAKTKSDGSVITEADRAMQHRLQTELASCWPDFRFLGEETPLAEQEQLLAQSANGIWCVDPLDGTSNYALGLPFFAVSLALVIAGRREIALVYDPVRDECFYAQWGRGAWLNGAPLAITAGAEIELRRALAVVDLKRLKPPLAAALASHPPYRSQRNFGACSLEWCWLAARRFHIYLHGGQKLWDYAAGSLILQEAGGSAATIEGGEMFALTLASRSVVAAYDGNMFLRWREWIGKNVPNMP